MRTRPVCPGLQPVRARGDTRPLARVPCTTLDAMEHRNDKTNDPSGAPLGDDSSLGGSAPTEAMSSPPLSPTGPVTLGSHEFFARAPEGAPAREPAPVTFAPLPPLPPPPTRLTGPIVVPTTSPAWIATGIAIVVGAMLSTVMFLERREKAAALTKSEAALAASEDALAKSQADLARARADAAERDVLVKVLERDRATLEAEKLAQDEELKRLKVTEDEIAARVRTEMITGDIKLTNEGTKITVDLVDKLLFDSGQAEISARGQEVLTRLGAALVAVDDRNIQVVGHTDDAPPAAKIREQFPTNWELSVARATNVVRFLQEEAKVPGKRLLATGRGQHQPIGNNANSKGRARNRRIEILLTPLITTTKAPPP